MSHGPQLILCNTTFLGTMQCVVYTSQWQRVRGVSQAHPLPPPPPHLHLTALPPIFVVGIVLKTSCNCYNSRNSLVRSSIISDSIFCSIVGLVQLEFNSIIDVKTESLNINIVGCDKDSVRLNYFLRLCTIATSLQAFGPLPSHLYAYCVGHWNKL